MTISVRLNSKLERQLEQFARREGISKSELIRRCLEDFLSRRHQVPFPWELGKELFGREGSGRSDLSTNRKSILREKLHGKTGTH